MVRPKKKPKKVDQVPDVPKKRKAKRKKVESPSGKKLKLKLKSADKAKPKRKRPRKKIGMVKRKRCHPKYDETKLLTAARQVEMGNLNVIEAAAVYNVPKSTISDRVQGRTQSVVGKSSVLVPQVERKLYELYTNRSEHGLTMANILDIAGKVAEACKMPFPTGKPTRGWYEGMKKRWAPPVLALDVKVEGLDEMVEYVIHSCLEELEKAKLKKEEERSGGERTKKLLWSEDNMKKAIKNVERARMSAIKAARVFKVPKSTLYDRLNGKYTGTRPGRRKTLDDKTETELYELAKKHDDYGLSKSDFLEIAGDVASERNRPFRSGRPSSKWYRNMMERCKEQEES